MALASDVQNCNSDVHRITNFLEMSLDFIDSRKFSYFCFFLSHHLNNFFPRKGDKYKYARFSNQDTDKRCMNIVELADKDGELDHFVYYLDKYCEKHARQSWPQLFYNEISRTAQYLQLAAELDDEPNPIEIRMYDFMAEKKIDMKLFCFKIPDYLKAIGRDIGNIFRQIGLDGRDIYQEVINEAVINGNLHYLLFCIIKFWFEHRRAQCSELLRYFFHKDLCELYTKCKKENNLKSIQELGKLIKKFTIKEKRYIKAYTPGRAIMGKGFSISLGILPKNDQAVNGAKECLLRLNAGFKDDMVVWRGEIKVKIKSYVPKHVLIIHKKKSKIQVQEPHDDVQWFDFEMKASTSGELNLRFNPKQGWKKICDDIEVKLIIESPPGPTGEGVRIIQLLELFFLFQHAYSDISSENRKIQAELFERIKEQEKEKVQLQEVLACRELELSEILELLQTLVHQNTKSFYRKKYRIKDGAIHSGFQSIFKYGLFVFPPLVMSYQLITLTYKPELERLVKSVLHRLPKPWSKRLYYSISDNENRIVGVDLGTSYSSIAIPGKLRGNHERIENNVTLLKDETGQWLIPSVVVKDEKDIEYVGRQAKDRVDDKPLPIISSKRYLGEKALLPFGKSNLLPEEVSTRILRHLKRVAEKHDGKSNKAVISVPAHFEKRQLQKTREAAVAAQFEMIEFIKDPVAAAMSYCSEDNSIRTIMTYDLGGGTFETTLIKKQGEDFEVNGYKWAHDINGTELDKKLVDWMVKQLELIGYPLAIARDSSESHALMLLAEEAKIVLSVDNIFKIKKKKAGVSSPVITLVSKIKHIKRETYETIIREDIERTIQLCRDLLREKELDKRDIDEIILMGGGSYIPLVSRRLKEEFASCRLRREYPCHCVAAGAAVRARQIESRNRGN